MTIGAAPSGVTSISRAAARVTAHDKTIHATIATASGVRQIGLSVRLPSPMAQDVAASVSDATPCHPTPCSGRPRRVSGAAMSHTEVPETAGQDDTLVETLQLERIEENLFR